MVVSHQSVFGGGTTTATSQKETHSFPFDRLPVELQYYTTRFHLDDAFHHAFNRDLNDEKSSTTLQGTSPASTASPQGTFNTTPADPPTWSFPAPSHPPARDLASRPGST